jgi:hypothetical protein
MDGQQLTCPHSEHVALIRKSDPCWILFRTVRSGSFIRIRNQIRREMAVQRCDRYRVGSWEPEANVAIGTHTAAEEAGTLRFNIRIR